MRRGTLALCALILLTANAFAQSAPATTQPPSVIRVRVVYTAAGTGGEGYQTSLTTVEPTFVVSELKDSPYPKKWPNRKQRRSLRKGEWKKLERAIDLKVLVAVPSQTCYGFIDVYDSCSTIEIDLADGKQMRIVFDDRKVPGPIGAVLKNIPNTPSLLWASTGTLSRSSGIHELSPSDIFRRP